jgi:proteic killer suppression protein
MIRNLIGKMTQDVYDGGESRHARKLPLELHGKAIRLLDQINAAPSVEFLRIPPSNRLEKLRGDWRGFWSLRINGQWRIVFQWEGDDAFNVEIVDYH